MKLLSGAAVVTGGRLVPTAIIALSGDRIADIRPGQFFPLRATTSSICTATSSFPASSTCTSTASRASTRSTATVRRRRWPPACRDTASPRSVRRPSRAARRAAGVLAEIRAARASPARRRARACSRAHLESNFINPEYRGAQPRRVSARTAQAATTQPRRRRHDRGRCRPASRRTIILAASPPDARVGIVTLAPELPGGTAI